jgi:hypothetical protein
MFRCVDIILLLRGQVVVCRVQKVEGGEPARESRVPLQTAVGRRHLVEALHLRHLDLPRPGEEHMQRFGADQFKFAKDNFFSPPFS